jgi:hypothetical protein
MKHTETILQLDTDLVSVSQYGILYPHEAFISIQNHFIELEVNVIYRFVTIVY